MNITNDRENFHVRHLIRTIEHLEELRTREGRRYFEIEIERYQQLLSECIGLHQRLTAIETIQAQAFALQYATPPVTQCVQP
jgi:hypothetical protein